MAIFDVLDLLGVLDISPWRLAAPIVIGIGAGLGVYYLSGQTPASAAVAAALWLAGLVIELVWQLSHRQRRRLGCGLRAPDLAQRVAVGRNSEYAGPR